MGKIVKHQWRFSDQRLLGEFIYFCKSKGLSGTTIREGKKVRVTTYHTGTSARQKFVSAWAAHSVVKE
jgi:hypothetical protein